MASFGSQSLNRTLTQVYINDDPSEITLLRPTVGRSPSGAMRNTGTTSLPPQTFKLIYQGGPDDGVTRSEGGQAHRFEYVIMCPWDADIKEGDTFYYPEGSGNKFQVEGLQPFNGYEKKAGAVAFGTDPHGG